MSRVFVRVKVKAKGVTPFRLGAWRDYAFLPRIGEAICLTDDYSSEFADEVYLEKVSSIAHYADTALVCVVIDEDDGAAGDLGWVAECVCADESAEESWQRHADNLCEWHNLKRIPDDQNWFDDIDEE